MMWKITCFITVIFNFAVEYDIRKVQANQEELKLNEVHQFLVSAADNLLVILHILKNFDYILVTSKEIGLETDIEKT
jgi:hypothetical protein